MDAKQQIKGLWRRSTEHFRHPRSRTTLSRRSSFHDNLELSATLSPSASELSLQTVDDNDPSNLVRQVRFRFYESFSLTSIESKFDAQDIKLITQSEYLIERILREEHDNVNRTVQWLGHLLTWRKQTRIRELSLDEFDPKLLDIHPLEFVHGGNQDILVCSMARMIKVTDIVGVLRANQLLICHFEELFSGGAARNLTLIANFSRVSASNWAKLSNRHLLNELICGCAYFRYPGFCEKVIFLDWPVGTQGKMEFETTIAKDWPMGIRSRITFTDHDDISKTALQDDSGEKGKISPDDLCIQSILYLLSEPSMSLSSSGGDSNLLKVNLKMDLSSSSPSQQTTRASTISSTSEFSSRLTTSAKNTVRTRTLLSTRPLSGNDSVQSITDVLPHRSSAPPVKRDSSARFTSCRVSKRPSSVTSAETGHTQEYLNNRTNIVQTRPRSGPGSDPGPPAKQEKTLLRAAPSPVRKSQADLRKEKKNMETVFQPLLSLRAPLVTQEAPKNSPAKVQTLQQAPPVTKERKNIHLAQMTKKPAVLPVPITTEFAEQKSCEQGSVPLQLNIESKTSGELVGFVLLASLAGETLGRQVQGTSPRKESVVEKTLQKQIRIRPNGPLESPKQFANTSLSVPEILATSPAVRPEGDTDLKQQPSQTAAANNNVSGQQRHAIPPLNIPKAPQTYHSTGDVMKQSVFFGAPDRPIRVSRVESPIPPDLTAAYRHKLDAKISTILRDTSTTIVLPGGDRASGSKSARSNEPAASAQSDEMPAGEFHSEFADLRTLQSELRQATHARELSSSGCLRDGAKSDRTDPLLVLQPDRTFTSLRSKLAALTTGHQFYPSDRVTNLDTLRRVEVNDMYDSRMAAALPENQLADCYTDASRSAKVASVISSGTFSRDQPETRLVDPSRQPTNTKLQGAEKDDYAASAYGNQGVKQGETTSPTAQQDHIDPYRSEHFSQFIRKSTEPRAYDPQRPEIHFVYHPGLNAVRHVEPPTRDSSVADLVPEPICETLPAPSAQTPHELVRFDSKLTEPLSNRPRIARSPQEIVRPDQKLTGPLSDRPRTTRTQHELVRLHPTPTKPIYNRLGPYTQKRSENRPPGLIHGYHHNMPSRPVKSQYDNTYESPPASERANPSQFYVPPLHHGAQVSGRLATPRPDYHHREPVAISAYYVEEQTQSRDRRTIRRVESQEFACRDRSAESADRSTQDRAHGTRSTREGHYDLPASLHPPAKDLRDAATSTHRNQVIKPTVQAKLVALVEDLPILAETVTAVFPVTPKSVMCSFSKAILPLKQTVLGHLHAELYTKAAEETVTKGLLLTAGVKNFNFKVYLWQARLFALILLSMLTDYVRKHKWLAVLPALVVLVVGMRTASPVLLAHLPTIPAAWFQALVNKSSPPTPPPTMSPEDPVQFSPRELFSYWTMGGKVRGEMKDSRRTVAQERPPPAPSEDVSAMNKQPPSGLWPAALTAAFAQDQAASCTEVEDTGPREILASWTMGSILRLGTKKLCSVAKRTIQQNLPTPAAVSEVSLLKRCSTFDASCLWRSITARFNPLRKIP